MRPGMLNRSAATLQATMLVSSLRESASSKSASSAPARSNVKGDAPLPKNGLDIEAAACFLQCFFVDVDNGYVVVGDGGKVLRDGRTYLPVA
ncbi:Uncharacterised protein [Neisseria gonorrhoeae]|nr:Uncharacterised protein [Neisseria gonorrhoeae]